MWIIIRVEGLVLLAFLSVVAAVGVLVCVRTLRREGEGSRNDGEGDDADEGGSIVVQRFWRG
jgi:hypothetical protein